MIGCHDAELARLELAGGELEPARVEALEQHLVTCERCRSFAAELDAIEAALQQTLTADAGLAVGDHASRFLAAVQQAPAHRRGSPRPAGSGRVSPFPFRLTGVIAAAAGLALAAGLGLLGTPAGGGAPLQLVRGLDVRDYQVGERLRPGDRIEASEAMALALEQAELTPAAGSVLRVDRLSPRVVTLEQGAVECAVVPGSGQFQLRAELGVVHVVGTRFVVSQSATELYVSVQRGRVELEAKASGERVSLGAGQSARLGRDGQVAVSGVQEPAPSTTAEPAVSPSPAATIAPAAGDDRVLPSLVNDADGALFEVRGRAPWLPDGTSLHVNLTSPGMGRELRVAFFMVLTQGGRFQGSFRWPNKRFAPLSYQVSVELYLESQPPQLRQQLMREFGFTGDSRQAIAAAKVELGSAAEREAHARQSLDQVERLLGRVSRLRERALEVTRFAPDDARRPRASERFMGEATREQEAARALESEFVVLREEDLLHELRNVIADAILLVEQQQVDPDLDPSEAGSSLEARLTSVAREIGTRRPTDYQVPDDE